MNDSKQEQKQEQEMDEDELIHERIYEFAQSIRDCSHSNTKECFVETLNKSFELYVQLQDISYENNRRLEKEMAIEGMTSAGLQIVYDFVDLISNCEFTIDESSIIAAKVQAVTHYINPLYYYH